MKYFITFMVAAMFVITSCTTQNQTAGYDDVYYSPKNQPPVPKHSMVIKTPETDLNTYNSGTNEAASPDQSYTDGSVSNTDTTYYTDEQSASGNLYDQDDYYDYAYSAQIKRFYNPVPFGGYYNDYYTNSYWYDPNPWNYGLSIYMGYNWWGPSYGFGYYPSYGYGYNPYYGYPYYDYGYPYYGYGGGFCYNDCYYNSYDKNSFYYGHRGGDVGGSSGNTSARPDGKTFGEKYEARLGAGRPGATPTGRGNGTVVTDPNRATNNNVRGGTAASQNTRNATNGYTYTRGQNTNTPANSNGRPNTTTQRPNGSNQAQRQYQYVAPNRNNQNATGTERNNVNNPRNTQSYTSPEYNRPRSGQEYTSPKYRNTQPSVNGQNNNRVAPSNNGATRTYARPTPQPTNSQPNQVRSSDNYRAPQNTSQPARSNTYSAPQRESSPSPQRSSDSYSPSRSSSSGSSSGSSGSSSGSSSGGSNRNSSSGSGGRR